MFFHKSRAWAVFNLGLKHKKHGLPWVKNGLGLITFKAHQVGFRVFVSPTTLFLDTEWDDCTMRPFAGHDSSPKNNIEKLIEKFC